MGRVTLYLEAVSIVFLWLAGTLFVYLGKELVSHPRALVGMVIAIMATFLATLVFPLQSAQNSTKVFLYSLAAGCLTGWGLQGLVENFNWAIAIGAVGGMIGALTFLAGERKGRRLATQRRDEN